ncbi:hypothetical protein SNE40_017461 [Patella caerulea]|uniref:Alpha-type protein kinase domain-containing protein n=1 Tax=Patella caerulea TaxID=87958 RepID=A0AAN8JHG6_PATCE
MFSLSNTTLSSSPDQDGCRYWTSFDPKSFSKGDRKKVFGGILNGKGPRRGEIVVIKAFKNMPGTESMCKTELCNNQKARELADGFNACYPFQHIEFSSILNALIDDVSVSYSLLNSNRKITKSEWVLMEENVGKHFVTFIDKHGVTSGDCPQALAAFMHWTYHVTSGQLVVCGLEGDQNMHACRLKTPTVHSINRQYGECDYGEAGINTVFRNHRCNNMCQDLIKPFNVNTQFPSTIYPSLPLEPSAPYEPDMFTFDDLQHEQRQLPSPTLYQSITTNYLLSQLDYNHHGDDCI